MKFFFLCFLILFQHSLQAKESLPTFNPNGNNTWSTRCQMAMKATVEFQKNDSTSNERNMKIQLKAYENSDCNDDPYITLESQIKAKYHPRRLITPYPDQYPNYKYQENAMYEITRSEITTVSDESIQGKLFSFFVSKYEDCFGAPQKTENNCIVHNFMNKTVRLKARRLNRVSGNVFRLTIDNYSIPFYQNR